MAHGTEAPLTPAEALELHGELMRAIRGILDERGATQTEKLARIDTLVSRTIAFPVVVLNEARYWRGRT